MRLVFFGTPAFAVPTLAALTTAGHDVRWVISQPSRGVGRGHKTQDPPVVDKARELGLEVTQPERIRSAGFLAALAERRPEVAVVVAFGRIFRSELLTLPPLGCINLHASLLPRHRGAAPIQAAIRAGETVTGVTTMQMSEGLDSGPILLQAELQIGDKETAEELAPRLAERGAALMVETLERLEAGTVEPQPQDDALATDAPRLEKSLGELDWRRPAGELFNQLRAYTPWPGSSGVLRERPLKILWAVPMTLPETAAPGTVHGLVDDRLAVACGNGTWLGLERVQRAGKKAVDARDFFHGERLQDGERFVLSDQSTAVDER